MAEMRKRRWWKIRRGEEGVIKKERNDIYCYPLLSIAIFQFLHSLQNVTEQSSSLSPFISLCITSFLVPAVHSSVSLLISTFFPTYSFSPSSHTPSNTCLFFFNNHYGDERIDLAHKRIAQILILSHTPPWTRRHTPKHYSYVPLSGCISPANLFSAEQRRGSIACRWRRSLEACGRYLETRGRLP